MKLVITAASLALVAGTLRAEPDYAAPPAFYDEPPIAEWLIEEDDIDWQTNPTVPNGIAAAMLLGNPAEAGPFLMRVRIPAGTRVPPHYHDTVRFVRVLQGVWRMGEGKEWDDDRLTLVPPGTSYISAAWSRRFHVTDEEVVLEISGMGPSGTWFVADRPEAQ
ncbi:MAG: cupin domain-containing protein [Pseudomonadota bacterium]